MMIFSANMVGRLVVDGQLRWWERQSKEKKVFLDECDALVSLSTVKAAALAAILDEMEGGALNPARKDYNDNKIDVKHGKWEPVLVVAATNHLCGCA